MMLHFMLKVILYHFKVTPYATVFQCVTNWFISILSRLQEIHGVFYLIEDCIDNFHRQHCYYVYS